MQSIRVLLADDHETVRQGLRLLVESQPDMQVIGEARDGRAAIASVDALHPDVIVLDVSMPEVNGLEAAQILKDQAPGTAVVALTRFNDDAYVAEFMRAGAAAYVLKQSSAAELLKAIRAAATGERYLDPALVRIEPPPRSGPREWPQVSARESEVLRLTAQGKSNKDIAHTLGISVKTVEVHKTNATRKLNLHSRIDIIRYAILQGWLKEV
jgi:DNA-binding NarL/FixJ family response regulator